MYVNFYTLHNFHFDDIIVMVDEASAEYVRYVSQNLVIISILGIFLPKCFQ